MIDWRRPLALLLAGVLVLTGACASFAIDRTGPRHPPADDLVADALFSQGRLWVLTGQSIDLSSFSEQDETPRHELGSVVQFCTHNGEMWALQSTGRGGWALRMLKAGAWKSATTIPGDLLETAIGIDCHGDAIDLLTTRRIVRLADGEQSETLVAIPLDWSHASVQATPKSFYVGTHDGEWGGVLYRIDRTTGQVRVLEQEPCTGNLHGCMPVRDLAPSPKPGCVVAALDLEALGADGGGGRLVEVCDDEIRTLYSKPRRGGGWVREDEISSVPFYSVALSGGTLWAWGADGLYRLDGDEVQFLGVPAMKSIGELRVTFELPGIVPVMFEPKHGEPQPPLLTPR